MSFAFFVMNIEHFNNDENESGELYSQFVNWLEDLTAEELKLAKGDRAAEKLACCRYYKRGYQANLSTAELIDFLGVSSPSILDKAGYSDEEAARFFEISDALTNEEIESVQLD